MLDSLKITVEIRLVTVHIIANFDWSLKTLLAGHTIKCGKLDLIHKMN